MRHDDDDNAALNAGPTWCCRVRTAQDLQDSVLSEEPLDLVGSCSPLLPIFLQRLDL